MHPTPCHARFPISAGQNLQMGDRDDKDVGRDPEFKVGGDPCRKAPVQGRGGQRLTHAHLATVQVFVGGISWQFKDADLKEAFSRYDPADAQCILDKATARPRGFGFVWFKNKLGMEDACRDMHNKVIVIYEAEEAQRSRHEKEDAVCRERSHEQIKILSHHVPGNILDLTCMHLPRSWTVARSLAPGRCP